MDEKELIEQEKRDARRRRRIRNQILAYITVIVLLCGIVAGGFFGIKYILDTQSEQQLQQEIIAQIEEELEAEQEEPIVLTEPETEPVVIEKTYEEKRDEIVDAAIEAMPLEDKVAGLFFVTPELLTGVNTAVKAGDGTKEALNKYAVGGMIYFSKNIQSEEQFTEMITNTKNWSKYRLFVGVDEEGGKVSRIAGSKIEVEKTASAADLAKEGDPALSYQAGQTIATYLNKLGLNLDFAPVADVAVTDSNIIGSRSFGSDPGIVAEYAVQMANGLQDGGVSACMKHFPGLGGTTSDTHEGMVSSERTLEDFRTSDFQVYAQGIASGVDMIMVSHLALPAITGDNTPSSLSPMIVTDLLRSELGFDGIIITDALNMKAVTEYYTADEAAVLALRAGCDMLLMPEDFEAAYQGILVAVQEGTIAEERINDALRRIYRVKLREVIEEQLGE